MNRVVFPCQPPLRARRDGWTPERQASFLAALGSGTSVAAAAATAAMSRESAYRLRANPRAAAFAASWTAIDAARQQGPTLMEILDDPDYQEAAHARIKRSLDEAAPRPDFTRWMIRRLNAMQKTMAKV